MAGAYGAPQFSGLLDKCVLWAPLQHSAGVSGDIDEFPIIPSGVTATNTGTFTKTSLGNNKSVLNFDGSTNYVSLTDNDAWYLFEGDFTISLWIYLNAETGFTRLILGQYPDSNNYWRIGLDSTNYLKLIGAISSTINFYYSCNFTQDTSTWHHIVIQRSGSSCLMFIDGVSKTVITTQSFQNTTDVSGAFSIGKISTLYWPGNLKDLMIWKGRALTQPEIKLLMNRTHPKTGVGLMPANGDYWRLS